MRSVRIPLDEDCTFRALVMLNPEISKDEMAGVFRLLPHALQGQAIQHEQLRRALNAHHESESA